MGFGLREPLGQRERPDIAAFVDAAHQLIYVADDTPMLAGQLAQGRVLRKHGDDHLQSGRAVRSKRLRRNIGEPMDHIAAWQV